MRRALGSVIVVAAWLLAAVVAGGCRASSGTQTGAPPTVPDALAVRPVIVRPYDETTPEEKFARAQARLEAGDAAAAAEMFDELTRDPRAAAFASAAIYDAGIAWEQAGDRGRALERFQEAALRFGATSEGKLAALRCLRLLAFLEHWSALSVTADALLARPDLNDVERLEGLGAKGLAIVEVGDPDGAERFLGKARDLVEALGIGQGGKLPLEVAQVQFALGEVRRLRSERILFDPLPPNFTDVLEARCRALLDAQNAYTEAMRSYDAHWAAMSGYRVGELYDRLYADLLAIAPPKGANTAEKKALFEGAMRLRYRVLLDKGLRMMEHTLMLADRTGEASPWIERAREAKGRIQQALREQKAVLARLPYTERQLERALGDLAKSHGGTL